MIKMVKWGTQEFADAYAEALNNNKSYEEAAADWEGDFLCRIDPDEEFLQDMERKGVVEGLLSYLDMMTLEQRRKYMDTPLGDAFKTKMGIQLDIPIAEMDIDVILSRISQLSVDDLKGEGIYCWADFWHGSVRNIIPVAPGEHENAVFKLSGKYKNWKLLISGQEDAVKLIMMRRLKLEGDLTYLMRRVKTASILAKEVFAGVPIE